MTIGGIKHEDIVQCDVRGERFYGIVSRTLDEHVQSGQLMVSTLHCHRTRIVTARQVIGHWRKRKARTA